MVLLTAMNNIDHATINLATLLVCVWSRTDVISWLATHKHTQNCMNEQRLAAVLLHAASGRVTYHSFNLCWSLSFTGLFSSIHSSTHPCISKFTTILPKYANTREINVMYKRGLYVIDNNFLLLFLIIQCDT